VFELRPHPLNLLAQIVALEITALAEEQLPA
jgi:hypothetical protein